MFMRLRRPLTNNQILKIVSLLNKSRKVLTVIGLIGIVWSSGPMQYLNSMNTQEIDFKNYIENDNFRENLSNTEDINYLDIPISHEVIDERTINTKTFQRIDGSYVTSIYSDAIHYFTEGNWENVDNSLNFDDTNNSFENKNNSFKVKFPKTLDDNKQIKLSKDGYSIDWNILSINESSIENDNTNSNPSNIKELININQSLLYSNIQPGVDVEYIITGSKVKENIILNNYIPNFNLSFEYKLKDLTLEEDDDGNVFFINSQGEKVFSFYELYMIDSDRNVSYDISFNIEELGNKEYLVTIVPNDNWLNNAQYPVTIDPTINSMDQWISIYDTTIDSTYVNNNYYNVNEMAIGSGYEGLVSFDIPSYLQDKVITYATLELTKALPYSSVIGDELVLHENTSNFDDTTVTWATWDGLSKYTNEIVDYQIISSSDKYLFNITESVINWVREGTMNVPGFTIKAKEGGSGLTVVESSEGTHGSMIPDINIGYVVPAGIKDYWTYSSHDIGLAGTGYISDYTGLLNIVRNDFEFSTEKQTLGLSMIYSAANFDENIGYGYGWRTNYDLTVQYDTDADRYSSTDSSGSTEFYQRKSTCEPKFKFDVSYNYTCYDAEDGSSNVLVIEKDSSYNLQNYYIVTPEDMIYKFDIYNVTSKVGYLTEIKDGTTVNELTISVNRQTTGLYKIDNVVDQSGNIFDFDYDTNGNIEEITLQLMQSNLSLGQIIEKVSYTVNDLKGTLTNVQYSKDYDLDGTFSDEPSVIYYYDTNELIEYAETSNAEKVLYNIDSASKRTYDMDISYNGSNIVSYDYTYDYKKTKIDDNFGNFIVYKFDDFGHTINIFDSYGYIQSYQYVNLFTE